MENCGWIYFQGGLALMDAVNSHVRDSLYNVFSNIKTVHAHVENVKRLNYKAYFFSLFFSPLKILFIWLQAPRVAWGGDFLPYGGLCLQRWENARVISQLQFQFIVTVFLFISL